MSLGTFLGVVARATLSAFWVNIVLAARPGHFDGVLGSQVPKRLRKLSVGRWDRNRCRVCSRCLFPGIKSFEGDQTDGLCVIVKINTAIKNTLETKSHIWAGIGLQCFLELTYVVVTCY